MRVATIASLAASAVLGLGALLVARAWLPNPQARPVALKAAPVQGVPVVLASGPIAYGAKLQPKDLVVMQLPPAAVPPGAYNNVAQVLKVDDGGAPVALMTMSAHEAVLPDKLSGAGARPTLAAMIDEGMRAYTIGVTDVAGGGGHILPGDHVDVVLTRNVGVNYQTGQKGALVSDMVIQNVKVLGMDLNADPNSTKAAVAHTATLEVSAQDSERLALAAQAGSLSLALRRAGQAEMQPVRAVGQNDLGPEGLPGPRAIAVHHEHRARPADAPSGVAVLVVHGDSASKVDVPSERLNGGV
jgi:pilus assembly protein CpaB